MFPSFPLQAVLDYRTSLVEALEIELSRLMASLQKARQVLETLRTNRLQLDEELRGAQLGELNLVRISHLRVNIELVDEYIERQEREVERFEKEVRQKREELIIARQEEEVLVILKDKAIEAFKEEMKIRENRVQDDVYIASFYQKRLKEAHKIHE